MPLWRRRTRFSSLDRGPRLTNYVGRLRRQEADDEKREKEESGDCRRRRCRRRRLRIALQPDRFLMQHNSRTTRAVKREIRRRQKRGVPSRLTP